MLNRASKPFVKLVERYLPDPFIFVLILTLVTLAAAVIVEQQSPVTVIEQWGSGIWGLLTFSMQMLLVLVTGFMLANTPLMKALLSRLAMLGNTPGKAIVLVTIVSLIRQSPNSRPLQPRRRLTSRWLLMTHPPPRPPLPQPNSRRGLLVKSWL